MLAVRSKFGLFRTLARRPLAACIQKCNLTIVPERAPKIDEQENRPRLIKPDFKGKKVNALFREDEMQRRLGQLREHMSKNNMAACVMTSYHNIYYYSGYLFCSFGRNFGLVITQDDVTIISPSVVADLPQRRSLGNNLIYTDWQRDSFFYAIQDALKHTKEKVGFELDTLPVDHLRKLHELIPNETADISEPAMGMRVIKSKAEIEVIKEGARIANLGANAMIEGLYEGVPEYEVTCKGVTKMTEEIAKAYPHADLRDTWAWLQSGPNSRACHNAVTSRRIKPGDGMILNCFPMVEGYYVALERTVFFDHVPDEALKYWEINHAVYKRGIEIIQPGVRCSDVAKELNDIYRQHGILHYRTFGYGHSFGVLSHYYGREAAVEFREDVDTVLQPGMVVSMEPMITIPPPLPGNGGYRDHDVIVVTEDGNENISNYPSGPEHLIIKP